MYYLIFFVGQWYIKGASILSAHESFKLSTGVVIDVMHCIVLGVVSALMGMWFGVGHRGKPFSIRNKVCTHNVPAHK